MSEKLYTALIRHKTYWLIAFSILTSATFLASISIGFTFISPIQVIHAILGNNIWVDEETRFIIFNYRIPVALAALVSGISLAICGATIQAITNNPLASPYTFGISSAAAFGAALLYTLNIPLIPIAYAATINAFLFALMACLGVLFLSKARGLTAVGVILAGICISFLFQAMLALMQYLATQEALQAIVFWMFGSLYKATSEKLLILAISSIGSFLLLICYGSQLTTMRLGDEAAQALGVNIRNLRLIVLIVTALVTAEVVSFFGIIPFICVAAPHIAGLFVGEDERYLLPCSALVGANILLIASVVSKIIQKGAIMPIGIVTSIVGIPILIHVLLTKK
jgi:iron complex transport system permease protein